MLTGAKGKLDAGICPTKAVSKVREKEAPPAGPLAWVQILVPRSGFDPLISTLKG